MNTKAERKLEDHKYSLQCNIEMTMSAIKRLEPEAAAHSAMCAVKWARRLKLIPRRPRSTK